MNIPAPQTRIAPIMKPSFPCNDTALSTALDQWQWQKAGALRSGLFTEN
jgi:hypothetical protein